VLLLETIDILIQTNDKQQDECPYDLVLRQSLELGFPGTVDFETSLATMEGCYAEEICGSFGR